MRFARLSLVMDSKTPSPERPSIHPVRRSPRRHGPTPRSVSMEVVRTTPRATDHPMSTPSRGRNRPLTRNPFPSTGSQGHENEDVDDATDNDEELKKKQLFTYFKRMSKKQLRDIGRHWMRKSSGNKDDYIYRNYRFVLYKKSQGRDLRSLIANNPKCPNFNDAMRNMEMSSLDLISPPSGAEVDARLSELGDPPEGSAFQAQPSMSNPGSTANRSDANVSTPEFTISEFARLIIILREDPTARNALFQLGQELSRTELDAGRSRDSFWENIASRFNDDSLCPQFSFVGSVDDADPSELPLCDRPASVLK